MAKYDTRKMLVIPARWVYRVAHNIALDVCALRDCLCDELGEEQPSGMRKFGGLKYDHDKVCAGILSVFRLLEIITMSVAEDNPKVALENANKCFEQVFKVSQRIDNIYCCTMDNAFNRIDRWAHDKKNTKVFASITNEVTGAKSKVNRK